jgi:transcriptional regulator GlxA family with amidase domain
LSSALQADAVLTPAPLEKHFPVSEIAQAWDISEDTVRRLFEREPGVLIIEPAPGRVSRRRRYRTLRIPAAVVDRVHRRLSIVNSGAQISERK